MTESCNLGFMSIRNEDGTTWWQGQGMWGPRVTRLATTEDEFLRIRAYAPETTKNNSPDNGYFGLMNLTFHPCTIEEAHEAELICDALAAEEAYYDQLEGSRG